MNTDISEKMLESVRRAKKQAKVAESNYDFAAEMIGIKAESDIDLFGNRAVSQVSDIAASSRKACDDLYASYQSLVVILDEECRPLLSQNPDSYAIKEVAEMIKWLNSESEIGANFSGSLNGRSLGDLVGVKYFPSLENKKIEKYWESQFEACPDKKEAEAKYRENKKKDREAEKEERKAARELERLEREREREEERQARQEEENRIANKENNLKDILDRERPKYKIAANWIGLGRSHVAVLKEDGRVAAIGKNDKLQCNVSGWANVVQIVCDGDTTYGLTKNGNVYVTGDNLYGQINATRWKNIKQIAAGDNFLIGIDYAGRIYSTVGGPTRNDTVESVMSWTNVEQISVYGDNVVAMKKDGSCVSANYNYYGRTDSSYGGTITHINNPIDIVAGRTSETIICQDGKVISIGGIGGNVAISAEEISKAGGIVKVYMYGNRPIGIDYEKKVIVGKNGDKSHTDPGYNRLSDFLKNINGHVISVACNGLALAFLTDKGQVYYYENSNSTVSEFKSGRIFDEGFHAFENFEAQVDKVINAKKYEEEKRRQMEEQAALWRKQGVCQHCGGMFKKGFFGDKCKKCGIKLDY